MNSASIIFIMTLCSAYMLVLSDHSRLLHDLALEVQKSKHRFYVLDGLLTYAVLYYKQRSGNLVLPAVISYDYKVDNKPCQVTCRIAQKNITTVTISVELYCKAHLYGSGQCCIEWDKEQVIITSWKIDHAC
jgi:hypothetical protein